MTTVQPDPTVKPETAAANTSIDTGRVRYAVSAYASTIRLSHN